MTKLLLAIPTLRNARRSIAWIDSMTSLHMPLGSSSGRAWIEGETIAEAREALARKAVEQDFTHIFFLGDDVLPPPNALIQLLDKIGRYHAIEDGKMAKVQMATGVYWTKTYPPEPYLYARDQGGAILDWHAGDFFPVDMAGCDCLLMETSVLRALEPPWFSTDWAWEDGKKPTGLRTEDFYFYAKAREKGFRLFADTSIQCWHEDRDTGVMFYLDREMPQASADNATKPEGSDAILVADLGAGLYTPYLGSNAKIVRFDGRRDVKPDVVCDIANIDERYDATFDVVHACHVLEHFPREMAKGLLRKWCKLLKAGGKVVLRVPNLEVPFRNILEGHPVLYDWQMIFGDQRDYDTAFHRNGFTPRKLEALLKSLPNLEDIAITVDDERLEIKGEATLRTECKPEALETYWSNIDAREKSAGFPPEDAETIVTYTRDYDKDVDNDDAVKKADVTGMAGGDVGATKGRKRAGK